MRLLSRLLCVLAVLAFLPVFSIAQVDTTNMGDEVKSELIYLQIQEEILTVTTMDGGLVDKKRTIEIFFKQGNDPKVSFQRLEGSGENLRKILEGDTLAEQKLAEAIKCTEQSNNSRMIWKSMQYATIGALFTGLFLYVKNDSGIALRVGLITAGAAYATLGVFYFRCRKKQDRFIEHVVAAVDIYNKNIIAVFTR